MRLNDARVRHVLAFWTERFPDDGDVLRMASDVVEGAADEAAANDARSRFYVDVLETRKYGGGS